MFHYLFTNDLRIAALEESLKDASKCFVSGDLPQEKSENNNVNTLGFYFNLTLNSNCAKEGSTGNVRKIVINFMKKFQFPNPRTKDSMNQAITDRITLAPIRTIFKLLHIMNLIDPNEAYLNDYEIAKYVFFNENVAKVKNPDLLALATEIIKNHSTNSSKTIPDDSVLQSKGIYWNQCRRQLREMVKVMVWSGCAEKNAEGLLKLSTKNLTRENEADLYEILSFNEYWTPDSSKDYKDNKDSYQSYMDVSEDTLTSLDSSSGTDARASIPLNYVIYGTPGCGKSFYVQNTLLPKIGVDPEKNEIRTTFFPDYTNVDFVGQIIPKTDGTTVTYDFNPGPFTLALERALKTTEPVALVIEELNRGNAASIFGDIFQLLDRDEKGNSRYAIKNPNLENYLQKEGISVTNIRIPSNLFLIATMNTSDQNVFKLDNAFKRRWDFQKMPNTFTPKHTYQDFLVPGMETSKVTWKDLVNAINEYMLSMNEKDGLISEDKQLGVYFVDENTLISQSSTLTDEEKEHRVKKFESKVLEYLWDDVAKYDPTEWFRKDINSLDKLIENYVHDGEKVFSDPFQNKLKETKNPSTKEKPTTDDSTSGSEGNNASTAE